MDISHLTQFVLSGMLSLIPPGKTVYSRTLIENCDTTCQATPLCADPGLLCLPPKFSAEYFELKIDRSKKDTLPAHAWMSYEEQVRFGSFTRPETYEEGLVRYAVIAEAITNISKQLSWGNINEKCRAECKNAPFSDSCKQCKSARPWMGSERELASAILTVFNFEGGFRQDVHSGVGPLARGDCKWMYVDTQKPAPPNAKGATPIKGTCRSVCLGQINIGSDVKFGYKAEDLVGTDLASTMRCAEVTGRILAQSRNRCSGPNSDRPVDQDWVAGMFGAYGSGGACAPMMGTGATLRRHTYPAQRAAVFRKVVSTTPELEESVKVLLGWQEPAGPVALSD